MQIKYFFAVAILTMTILFLGSPSAVSGITIAELQAQIQALMQQLSELQAQQDTTPSQWCHTFNSNLGYANSGSSEVGYLHTALQKENFSYAPDTDNVYADGTSQALIQFQKKYGILQNGYAGPTTRAKLNSLYGCAKTANQSGGANSSFVAPSSNSSTNNSGSNNSQNTASGCVDSDSADANAFGSYTYGSATDSSGVTQDICSNDTAVFEAYCTLNGSRASTLAQCAFGCWNGKCNSESEKRAVTVKYPNGGEVFTTDKIYTISYSVKNILVKSGYPLNIYIERGVQGGATNDFISIAGTLDSQKFSFDPSKFDMTGDNFTIKVCSYDGKVCDRSDNYFSINASSVTPTPVPDPTPNPTPIPPTTCISSWTCDLWSACVDSKQSRNCYDLVCQTPDKIETQVCSTICNPSWNCSSWSACTNGQQTQLCSDSRHCLPNKVLTQTCTSTCNDSDGGLDYFTKGSATDKSGVHNDLCVTASRLAEYYCNKYEVAAYQWQDCPDVCSNGACNRIVSLTPSNSSDEDLIAFMSASLATIAEQVKALFTAKQ